MAQLHLHNTLHNDVQLFTPQDESHVRMYVCGPTVYGPVHIGNARPAAVFDLLYRLLKRHYPKVTYARNITDIDDKIINTAAKNGELPETLAKHWHARYSENMQQLGVLPPDEEPLATAYMPQIINMIERLLQQNVAYAAEGHVLFHVPAFSDYGQLSNRKRDDMIAGARVEVAPYKKDPADFILWKPSKDDVPGWESPWGRGRPGWHIECSAMAESCLGKEIDIHGGGQDLIFPHHENELAQSRCAHNTPHFARFWVHNGHVRMDGEKMSKSLNNVLLLQDILAHYDGETARLALFSTHYRRPLNWTASVLADAKATLDKWYRVLAAGDVADSNCNSDCEVVEKMLLDDLNTPAAIAELHQLAHNAQHADDAQTAAAWRGQLKSGAQLLGLLNHDVEEWFHGAGKQLPQDAQIEEKINQRLAARAARDFAAADAIRDELAALGILLEDTADGTTWRIK
ncbi:MAG: cysteine--tRNA ligase [Proteobacteria bacterium]|nr:cysteine--tRNA ligase [Pseudomonadota bacterium]